MAVNIDTVYQRVLALTNKEQRGFITPQKFNLYANQVSLNFLNDYFIDLDYHLAQFAMNSNSSVHADAIDILKQKISHFEKTETTPAYVGPHFTLPSDLYRLSALFYGDIEITPISRKLYRRLKGSPIGAPTNEFPVYVKNEDGVIVHGAIQFTNLLPSVNPIDIEYIKVPTTVEWGYTTVLGEPQYNPANSVNFELDASEEDEIVMQIIKLAGIEIKDTSVYQTALGEEMQNIQFERQ